MGAYCHLRVKVYTEIADIVHWCSSLLINDDAAGVRHKMGELVPPNRKYNGISSNAA